MDHPAYLTGDTNLTIEDLQALAYLRHHGAHIIIRTPPPQNDHPSFLEVDQATPTTDYTLRYPFLNAPVWYRDNRGSRTFPTLAEAVDHIVQRFHN